mmetsp:Transcript_3020/g.3160  ORF Transcript_3020/g.3160 Transcript_3020/m.3160 type:complete len:236 (+) Transcript_3020:116-823(+)
MVLTIWIILLLHVFISNISYGYSFSINTLTPSVISEARTNLLSLLSKSSTSPGLMTSPVQYSKFASILELSQTRKKLCFPDLFKEIDGDWLLKYTNNIDNSIESEVTGISGGVPKGSSVVEVIQRINSAKNCVDHIITYSLPLGSLEGTFTLRHDLSVTSDSEPAQLAIDLKEVSIQGFLNPFDLPAVALPGPAILRRGLFDVTYLDDGMRISRGPYGELRIFTRQITNKKRALV